MSEHEDAYRDQCHALLSDARDLLLLLGVGGPVSPVEIIWGTLEALIVDAAGRAPADPTDVDRRADEAISTLRETFSVALEAARRLAGTDRHDPLWGQRHAELLQALADIKTHYAELSRIAGERTMGAPPRLSAHRPLEVVEPETPAPLPDHRGAKRRTTDAALGSGPGNNLHNVQQGMNEPPQRISDDTQSRLDSLGSSLGQQFGSDYGPLEAGPPDSFEDDWQKWVMEPPDGLEDPSTIPEPDVARTLDELFPDDPDDPGQPGVSPWRPDPPPQPGPAQGPSPW
jgi:hypothetical protein